MKLMVAVELLPKHEYFKTGRKPTENKSGETRCLRSPE